MKYHFISLAIIFHTLISVQGQYLYQKEANSETDYNIKTKYVRPERHSRNRRQPYYNNYQDKISYNIPQNYLKDMVNSISDIATSLKELTNNNQYRLFYYNRREDRTSNCEESIRKILVIVEELATRAKYTPPLQPPQVIFIPYPVYEKTKEGEKKNVTFPDRLGPIDTTRIWFKTPKEIESHSVSENEDGARPISFKPIVPKRPTVAPPLFEHGSKQEGMTTITSTPPRKPSKCEFAVLSCCGLENEEQKECFATYTCAKTYDTGKACDPRVINMVMEKYAKIYGPTKF